MEDDKRSIELRSGRFRKKKYYLLKTEKKKEYPIPLMKKRSNLWYYALIIGISIYFIISLIFLNFKLLISIYAIIFFLIFCVIQIYSMKKKLYYKERANKFFASWKAIDIWTHFIGSFANYLITLALIITNPFKMDLNPFKVDYSLYPLIAIINFLISLLCGLLFELIEYISEKIYKKILLKQGKLREEELYPELISENRKNILQDLIMNGIGAFCGLLFVFIIGLV